MAVGDGFDVGGQAPSGSTIGSFSGFFATSGLTSEYNSLPSSSSCRIDCYNGVYNCYSIQDNSNFFPTTYGNEATTGWEQFVMSTCNGTASTEIQYWLINWLELGSGNTQCPTTLIPGSGGWSSDGSDCYANSYENNTKYGEPITDIAQDSFSTYADSNGYDIVNFCDFTYACYRVAEPSTVLNLYQSWTGNEFNILGYGDGSEAVFNSGTDITVGTDLATGGGSLITPSCGPMYNQSAEYNNLYVDSCSSGKGSYLFSESTTAPAITVQSVDQNNNKLTGYYTVLYNEKGSTINTGFTPVTFTLSTYEKYVIRPEDYGNCFFGYWQDTGNTTRYRSFLITQESQTITAVYNCGSTGNVTVNTVDQNNNPITGYYVGLYDSGGTLINHGFSPVTFTGLSIGTKYSVEPDNYGSCSFNHWQDTGSTTRDRSFVAASAQTFTAVYECT